MVSFVSIRQFPFVFGQFVQLVTRPSFSLARILVYHIRKKDSRSMNMMTDIDRKGQVFFFYCYLHVEIE